MSGGHWVEPLQTPFLLAAGWIQNIPLPFALGHQQLFDTHSRWSRQSTLLSPPIQIQIPSRNTLTDIQK